MRTFLIIILFFKGFIVYSQELDTVEVSNSMTTTILFDSDISFVDIGSKFFEPRVKGDVLLLNMKPNSGTVSLTTLTVKTEKSVSVWLVKYSSKPKKYFFNQIPVAVVQILEQNKGNWTPTSVSKSTIENSPIANKTGDELKLIRPSQRVQPNELVLKNTFPDNFQNKIETILKSPQKFWDVAEKRNNLLFTLHSIYVDTHYMYFAVSLLNYSSIAFAIDYLSIERIPSSKGLKKNQVGTGEDLRSEYEYTYVELSPDKDAKLIYCVPLRAFDDKDSLEFKISELGGSRTLHFTFSCSVVSKAKQI